MKARILIALMLSVTCTPASFVLAQQSARGEELPQARSDGPIVIYRKVYVNESLPDLGARLYDKVDYELKLSKLTHDIRITEGALAAQRERARVYDKYFGRTSALLLTRQNARLNVLRSEEQLKLLRQEKLLALRHRNDQIRYRKLLIGESVVRLTVND
ncbi:MAG: hypothetical protein H8E66_02080 [Planctomycetes bacterium]|nr:hypothetical protein [Planctomycetota bacterium]